MITKAALGLTVVLGAASISLAATQIHTRSGGNHFDNPSSSVENPFASCSVRVAFPACTEGNLD
jgi:hypothetical protein